MSEQPAEGQQAPEIVELAPSGDGAFASLMDFLAPEEGGSKAAPVGGEAAATGAPDAGSDAAAGSAPAGGSEAAAGSGQPDAASGAQPDAGGADAPGDAKPADGAAAGDAADSGAAARPAEWTATAADQVVELGKLSTAFEENTQNGFRAEALADTRKEYPKYFEALETHPRLLVGREVPRVGAEGTEVLKDANDAREWQEAVKTILFKEVTDRASVKLDENRDFIQTIHASIDLFKNNPDLIPGTKDFDVDLANTFATFAKPYEVRDEGKLVGYSVPVQPLIDQLREQVIAKRTAAAPAAAATPPAAGQEQQAVDPPQAGIPGKAGSGGDGPEDFATLFGTLAPGLNIRI